MIPLLGSRRKALLLGAGVAVLALGECGVAFAMFTDSTTAGPGSFQTGTLPTPGGLAVSNGGCAGGAEQTNVTSSWTGSPALDGSGNYLVAGYSVLRSAGSSGPYSTAGTVSGTPPPTAYTDTNPSGAASPLAVVASGSGSNALSIDTSTYAVATVTLGGPVGKEPNALQVTPDGTKLIVAEGAAHQVQIVSTATGAVTGTVSIPAVGATPSEPNAVAVNPAGTTAWIVDAANARVYPLSLATSTLGGAITVGAQGDPTAMVVTPNAVPGLADTDGFVPNGGDPNILAVTPDGAKVYVASFGGGSVEDITTSNDAVATTFALPPGGVLGPAAPNALALTPNGCQLYVNDYDNNKVDLIDVSADTLAASTTAVGQTGDPTGMAVTPNGAAVYVANFYDPSVSVIATSSYTVTRTVGMASGSAPYAIAIIPSSYYYEVAGTHGGWTSVPSSPAMYTLGWNVGGWQ